MKYIQLLIISFFILLVLGSCGRRGVPQRDPMYPGYGYYDHGFYYANHFYDPRFYNFIPRGNRIIIIDNRTNQQVAAPRRRQIREVPRSEQQQVENARRRPAERDRDVDTRRREQTDPQRSRRSQQETSPHRDQRRQERASPAPTERRTSPSPSQRRTEPSQPQQRSTEGQTPGSRRGGSRK